MQKSTHEQECARGSRCLKVSKFDSDDDPLNLKARLPTR